MVELVVDGDKYVNLRNTLVTCTRMKYWKGLCFCEDHREQAYAAYLFVLDGDVEEANKMLGRKAA